jgi:hypothetical protein
MQSEKLDTYAGSVVIVKIEIKGQRQGDSRSFSFSFFSVSIVEYGPHRKKRTEKNHDVKEKEKQRKKKMQERMMRRNALSTTSWRSFSMTKGKVSFPRSREKRLTMINGYCISPFHAS